MEPQVTTINRIKKSQEHRLDKHTEETDDGKTSSDLIKTRNGTILLVLTGLVPTPLMS